MNDLRPTIETALKGFNHTPLREAGLTLLSTLGYHSDRTLDLGGSPEAFLEQFADESRNFHMDKALVSDWKRIELLFQLTGGDLAGQSDLFDENQVKQGNLQSYLFFALELSGESYARGKLSQIARQINRLFSAPVMLLIKHREQKEELLSIAVINRRPHKRDEDKDVLGKVTLIRNISLAAPHRGHVDILADFALPALEKSRKGRIDSFDALHAAWEEVFNVELLNKRFYRELANWYFWALPQVSFPEAGGENEEKRNATGLIRLLTRLIFCWFIKEKGLVPEELFDREEMERTLTDLDDDASTYYCAILQNLFFATLNQRMGKNHKGEPHRRFALDEGFPKNKDTYGVDTLYRYEGLFRDPDSALGLFADVPFLNGGLFECLDRVDDEGKKIYIDGFSRNPKRRPVIPNRLFFASEQEVDLSGAYGEKKRNHEKARGLLHILHSYKFTIVENTPVDQEIALDPELLGKVFENLLASYNEETKTTARKQTGSFYTPRPIVDYMVDESLKAYLRKELCKRCPKVTEDDAKEGLEILFAYTEREHAFSEEERLALIRAIDACKILDPACGSGAFPMGILHKLVFILGKLDPGNQLWKDTQLAKLDSAPMREALEAAFEENDDDYGRKLYLIENCLYGVDIQPIAIQISKLRFFISLVCDQKTNRDKAKNHGIRPLPNLETKFVAADTLIRLPEAEKQTELFVDPRVEAIEKEIESLYHSHFGLQRRDQKITAQKKLKALREELADMLATHLGFMSSAKAKHIAEWNPFDPQSVADFFDPHWMFGRKLADGFDIVIGNPPYVFGGNGGISKENKKKFKNLYVSGSGKINLFTIFIERGAQILRPEGILSYIIPNTLLRVTSYKAIRKYILELLTVDEILDLDVGVFDKVTASTIAIRLLKQKSDPLKYTLIKHGLDDDSGKIFKQESWLDSNGVIDIFSSQKDRDLINKIESNCDSLEIYCHRLRFGVVISGNFEEVVKELNASSTWKPFLEGDEISSYSVTYKGRRLNYSKHLLHRSRTSDIFECRKIMIQRITGGHRPLKAVLDEDQYYNKESILNLILKSECINMYGYLTAVINSSVANWYYKKRFTNASKLTVNLSKEYVGKIPIKKPTSEENILFETLVSMVQLAKREKWIAEAGFLESLIDACVLESYFPKEAESTQLNFKSQTLNLLGGQLPITTTDLQSFLNTANAPSHPLRNQLLRLTSSSPELFGVIKEEGRV